MNNTKIKTRKSPSQYLSYFFEYEGRQHRRRIELNEDVTAGLNLLCFDSESEISWVKKIKQKGVDIEINITLNDDEVSYSHGKVVASAWVNVYAASKQNIVPQLIDSFEPDGWSYEDEEESQNNVCKSTFYENKPKLFNCTRCPIISICRIAVIK